MKDTKTAFDSRTNAWTFDPADLILIENPDDPLYDPRVLLPLDEPMVLSIMFQGVIEPVIIAKQANQPVVVDGRQRVKCAREANRRLREQGKEPVRVTAVVRRGTDADLFGVVISTNENRQDDTPLGRAEKCSRYLAMGRKEGEAAIAFGVTKQTISQWMKLLQCAPAVRKAVERGQLTSTDAAKLSNLPRGEQNDKLEALLADAQKDGRRRVATKAVAAATGQSKTPGKKQIKARLSEAGFSDDYKSALRWVLGQD